MDQTNFNWEAFKRCIIVRSDLKSVYRLIATSEGIAQWFIGEANYRSANGDLRSKNELISKDDSYYWKWFHKELELNGNIIDANGSDFVSFTFGDAGTVSIKLKDHNGRILIELIQEVYPGKNYDKFAHINCYVCWSFFLINLKSVVENGIDLRETEAEFDSLANW